MANKRLFTVWYDVVNKVIRSSDGNQIGKNDKPYIVFREQPLMNLHLVTDDQLTPYTEFSSSEVYSAAIDKDFDHTDSLMCKTEPSGINIAGDWESGGNADPAQGEFSIRLDANTEGYNSKIGTSKELRSSYFELLVFNSTDGSIIGTFQFEITTRNIIDDSGTAIPVTVVNNMVKVGEGVNQCIKLINDGGVTLAKWCPPGVSC